MGSSSRKFLSSFSDNFWLVTLHALVPYYAHYSSDSSEDKLPCWRTLVAVHFSFGNQVRIIKIFNILSLFKRDPEDKVFTATFSISGLLAMTTMIIAYKFFESCNPKDSSKTNKIGLLIGLAGAFFKLMVGGYSVYTAPNLHFICAGLAFFLGTVYCNIMTVVTKR